MVLDHPGLEVSRVALLVEGLLVNLLLALSVTTQLCDPVGFVELLSDQPILHISDHRVVHLLLVLCELEQLISDFALGFLEQLLL